MHYADDDWAVFWCSLLAPILLEEVEPGERNRFLKNLSQQEVTLPNGRRKRISLSTLRRKVRRFRQQKIAGLRRQQRGDRGQPRKQRQAMLQRAIELKKEQPRRYGPESLLSAMRVAIEFRTCDAAYVETILHQQRRKQSLPSPTEVRPRRKELIDLELEPPDPSQYDRFTQTED